MPLTPPPIFPVRHVKLPALATGKLSNGIPFYQINQGTQELVRIEFVFWAGRPYEKLPLAGRSSCSLLKEGSLKHSGKTIAEHFDFYGAGLNTPFQMDTANIVMYALNKQLPKVLPLFMEVINSPAYAAEDLQAFCNRKTKELKEDIGKAEVLAYRRITESFFGKNHPYGYNSTKELYQALRTEDLHEHHQRTFHAQNGFVLISGRIDKATEGYIHEQLAQLRQGEPVPQPAFTALAKPPKQILLPVKNSAQASIRMGRKLFSRQHEDADGLYILAHLLGGYFGSRLMENIREDKGYTYNISASFDSLRYDGALQIDTEVSPEFLEPCLQEIRFELRRLREERVGEEEMEMVRNYLMGAFLTMIDGPFNWAETVRTLLVEQLDISAFQRLVQRVQNIQASEIQELAQRYLQEEDLWTVIAGAVNPAE